MYLLKLTTILLSAILGHNSTIAQEQPDFSACSQEDASYWKLMAGSTTENPIVIRFEQPEKLLKDNCCLRRCLLKHLEGKVLCKMKISLQKNKVSNLRIYWSATVPKYNQRLTMAQRTTLRNAFLNMDVEVLGEPPAHLRFYKTTWICILDRGQLKKI